MAVEQVSSVLMTADTVGGVWTYAIELARALCRSGVRVHLATMGGPVRDHQREQSAHIAGLTLYESEYKLEWMQNPWADVQAAGEWLLDLETRTRPDVVHLNQFAFGASRFRAPKLVVAHSCVVSWWQAVHGEEPPAEWDEYRRVVSQGLARAQLVAAPSFAMLSTLAHNYGYQGEHVVLPNARDAAQFQPGPKRDVVFAAGRLWDEAKNLVALDAVAEHLPWPVRVAGSCVAPHGGMIRPRWAHPLGEIDAHAVAREMATAAIYALPARYEPFGLSILEAALSGCALVLGDIASLRETWGANALYVPPDDHDALHCAITRLIADPAERERLGRAARSRALRFHPQRMAQCYLRAYSRLVQEEAVCA
jgi:glycosyltransferase involved in cell wall biosynthesis